MAEQIPYGVATSLINRLASAAFREFGRIYGVKDELERLKNTVESAKICIGRPVHVSVKFDALCLLKLLDASRLRTLIMLSSRGNALLDREELAVISTFKYLRVLKLRGLESISKSIGNLVCLQTIEVTSGILDENFSLPTKLVSKLINLRHLVIYNLTSCDKTPIGFQKLSVQQNEGVIFSKWLSPLTNIIEISLNGCQSLQYLPPLERLPFLKSLKMISLYNLEYIYYEEPIVHESFFSSLESLKFISCRILRGWRKMGDDFNDIIINSSHNLLLSHFPRLSILEIGGCWMLTCMPIFPNIEKRLSLTECNVQIGYATSHHFSTSK
ncbi:hypothetical protein P8452_23634 [Trifolium repens]|nr:hypothetical protein P8452_23634 [Trifolium repens]